MAPIPILKMPRRTTPLDPDRSADWHARQRFSVKKPVLRMKTVELLAESVGLPVTRQVVLAKLDELALLLGKNNPRKVTPQHHLKCIVADVARCNQRQAPGASGSMCVK